MPETLKLAAFALIAFSLIPAQPATDDKIVCEPTNEVVEPDTKPEVKPAIRHAEIVFYCGPNCVWCDKWRTLIPGLRNAGWDVIERKSEPRKAIPYFDVWLNGKCHRHNGYMSYAQLRRIMGEKQPVSVAAVQDTPRVSPRYVARWTYPAPLSNHLASWPHNMNTSGMTQAEMLKAHDDCHDKIGPVSSAQIAARSFSANCPSGNCPTVSTRRGFFGWRR